MDLHEGTEVLQFSMWSTSTKSKKSLWARRAALAVLAGLFIGSPAAGANSTKITVPISTVRNAKGSVFVAIYRKAQWLQPGRYVTAKRVRAQKGTVFATFKGLPPGKYAVAVFHDENSNNRVDTNVLGLPKEGYGFSRHSPRLKKPKFEDVAVNVRPMAYAPIRLRY